MRLENGQMRLENGQMRLERRETGIRKHRSRVQPQSTPTCILYIAFSFVPIIRRASAGSKILKVLFLFLLTVQDYCFMSPAGSKPPDLDPTTPPECARGSSSSGSKQTSHR